MWSLYHRLSWDVLAAKTLCWEWLYILQWGSFHLNEREGRGRWLGGYISSCTYTHTDQPGLWNLRASPISCTIDCSSPPDICVSVAAGNDDTLGAGFREGDTFLEGWSITNYLNTHRDGKKQCTAPLKPSNCCPLPFLVRAKHLSVQLNAHLWKAEWCVRVCVCVCELTCWSITSLTTLPSAHLRFTITLPTRTHTHTHTHKHIHSW